MTNFIQPIWKLMPASIFFQRILQLILVLGILLVFKYALFPSGIIQIPAMITKTVWKQQAITFEEITSADQEDPNLHTYLKKQLMIEPSGKKYNLTNPKNPNYSQYKQYDYLSIYYAHKDDGTFIEVGGYDGETSSNTLNLEIDHGWTGLLIEPSPINYKTLISKNRRVKAVRCCLSDTPKPKRVFFILANDVSQITKKSNLSEKIVEVWCYPLYSLMVAADLTTVDFLSIDLEGFEVKALENIPWEKVDIKAVLIEFINIPNGKSVVMDFMVKKNYTLLKEFQKDFFFAKKKERRHIQ